MPFPRLEEHLLETENIDKFERLNQRLCEPTKTVLSYVLDIGALLDKENMRFAQILFGGYGVLAHLAASYGEDIASLWRGSSDIDMGGNDNVLRLFHRAYTVTSDRPSPNLHSKRTLKIEAPSEHECKIDFYQGPQARFDGEIRRFFSIPLHVASPLSLIKEKVGLANEEETHGQDIVALLSVLERRGTDPHDVEHKLSTEEKRMLHGVLKTFYGTTHNRRMSVAPSRTYKNELDRLLKRY